MKTTKKLTGIFLTFAIIISVFTCMPVNAGASATLDPSKMTFEEFLVANFENFAQEFDISYYIRNNSAWLRLGRSDIDALIMVIYEEFESVLQDNPHLFHVETALDFSYYLDFSVFDISPHYIMTRAQYNSAVVKFNDAVKLALDYAKGAANDFEKALLLHDYIVLNTVYDVENLEYMQKNNYEQPLREVSHNAYGALVDGLAVCDGYARAYAYLLKQVGVESRFITGIMGGGPHIWNLVKVGGGWFHVDTTANDPVINGRYDMLGRVNRTYFLISDAELRTQTDESGARTHSAWTLPTGITANSTVYDGAFIRDINTAVVKLDGFYYWIDSINVTGRGANNNRIVRYNITTGSASYVHSFESIWYLDGTEASSTYKWDISSYCGIAAYNGLIYFNTAKDIRSYNPATGAVEVVNTPANLGGTGNRFIFGLIMQGDTIHYSVRTQAASAGNMAQVKISTATQPQPQPQPSAGYTIDDAIIILQFEAGLIASLTAEQQQRYDLNNDNIVNITDAIILLRVIAGLIQL